jgi:hypothetical protein
MKPGGAANELYVDKAGQEKDRKAHQAIRIAGVEKQDMIRLETISESPPAMG